MVKKVIEASMAVAIGAKLCEPDVVPMYPITPQTHIVERLADFINDGELNSIMIHLESEFAALSAAMGVSATGSRVFTATASQGVALMHEVLHAASGMRMPIVMAVANRALSAPINIWNDHQDTISARDTGWIQLYVESAQEALDTTIMAYKIAENKKVLLPIMVCLDGFTLSHVYEPVDIPIQSQVRKFLPKYVPQIYLDTKKPVTIGPIAFPNTYMLFKKDQQNAIMNSAKIIKTVNSQFSKQFKRKYGDGLLEAYKTNDAKEIIIAMGTVCSTARTVIDNLRKKGKKVGLLKVKCYRPFPVNELQNATKNIKQIAVIDKDVSYGYEGALSTEVRNALCQGKKTIKVKGYIAGLGGKDIKPSDIEYALKNINNKKENEWLL